MRFPLFEEQISADQFSLEYLNYPHLRDYILQFKEQFTIEGEIP